MFVYMQGTTFQNALNNDPINPGTACFVRADVSKEVELKNLVDVTVQKFGRIDCLINNAGWHPPPKTIDFFSGVYGLLIFCL